MVEKKATIINAQYIEKIDSVVWEVQDKEGTIYPLTWKRNKFGEAFSIKGAEDIAPNLLAEFCNKMLGKEINLINKDE